MADEVVPKKGKDDEPGRTRSIWAGDALWDEISLYARQEGYSVSKFVGFLLRAGLSAYLLQRQRQAAETQKP